MNAMPPTDQLLFELGLAQAALPVPRLTADLPSPLLGEADVLRLQAEGWAFAEGGLKLANCYACWALRADEWKPCFLADPEQFPHAWSPA